MRKLVLTVLALATVLLVPSTALAFSPGRPTINWPNNSKDIVFNSSLGNPAVGDEREFLLVRSYADNNYTKNLKVSDGQEIVLRIYFRNDAASNKVAKNVRVNFSLPNNAATTQIVSASIASDNAQPKTVSDTAELNSDKAFTMEYEQGSAQIWNNNLRGNNISDSVITSSGALVGEKKIDGKIPGGGNNSGYATILVKVHSANPSPSATTGANSGKIANSGPGDVVTLFAGASAFGAIGHRLLVKRKSNCG